MRPLQNNFPPKRSTYYESYLEADSQPAGQKKFPHFIEFEGCCSDHRSSPMDPNSSHLNPVASPSQTLFNQYIILDCGFLAYNTT
jgi:hypothetical protein